MVPRDRVRAYLLSVFPVSDRATGEDNRDNNFDDEDDGNEEYDDGDDFDSDSSDDSIMMPSLSRDVPSVQVPATTANDAPDSAPQIPHDMPTLFGRGVNSATAVPVEGLSDATQLTKPSAQAAGGAAAAEMSDPRVFMSFQAPTSTAALRGGVIHSVPATGRARPPGRVHYGSKIQLRRFASLWQVRTERARRDGMSDELFMEGVILTDFRNVSCSHRYSFLWSPYVIGQTIIFSSCFFFFLLSSFFFSSPNLSSRRLDVFHTSAHGVVLV